MLPQATNRPTACPLFLRNEFAGLTNMRGSAGRPRTEALNVRRMEANNVKNSAKEWLIFNFLLVDSISGTITGIGRD